MKRLFLALLFAGAVCASHAQVVQGTRMTVERKSTTGYRGFIEPGLALAFDLSGRPGYRSYGTEYDLDLSTTHGYQFPSGLFLGGGTGFGSFRSFETFSIPIYANGRYYFPSRFSSRFYTDVRFGYNISVSSSSTSVITTEVYDLCGWFASAGFGLEIGRFSVSINYMPRQYKWNELVCHGIWNGDLYWTEEKGRKIAHSLSLRIGFCF